MPDVYIGLGSNLGDRLAYLEQAVAAFSSLGAVRRSSWYETEPVGMVGAGRFLNGVVRLSSVKSARGLLFALMNIEKELGRCQVERKSSRTIDLDILLYGSEVINEPDLEIPHPRMHLRAFVLIPLCELAPHLVHPRLKRTMRELLAGLDISGVVAYHSAE